MYISDAQLNRVAKARDTYLIKHLVEFYKDRIGQLFYPRRYWNIYVIRNLPIFDIEL